MLIDKLQTWINVELWRLPAWYTRAELASFCGCSKSPSFLALLQGCVEAGVFEHRRTVDAQRRAVIVYRISDEYRERVFEEAKQHAIRKA